MSPYVKLFRLDNVKLFSLLVLTSESICRLSNNINWHALFTEKPISGLVMVTY